MAQYRQVHCMFWNDPEVQNFTTEEKLFYLYLLTNPRSRQCGISEISIKQMSFETGLSIRSIDTLLIRFQSMGKIKYSRKTNEIALRNWRKYNPDTSPKVKVCITKELALIKDSVLIEYIYSIGTPTQEEGERREEEDKEKERTSRSQFEVPTLEEVTEEFTARGFPNPKPEAEKFWNFYEAKGWLVGKTKMKKWKSAVAGWISRSKDFAAPEKINRNGYSPPNNNQNSPAYKPYVDKSRDVVRQPMPQEFKTLVSTLTDKMQA